MLQYDAASSTYGVGDDNSAGFGGLWGPDQSPGSALAGNDTELLKGKGGIACCATDHDGLGGGNVRIFGLEREWYSTQYEFTADI